VSDQVLHPYKTQYYRKSKINTMFTTTNIIIVWKY
jgi:hypothetical protein